MVIKKHICNKACANNCPLIGTVEIPPVEKRFKVKQFNSWCTRFMIPLTLCWGSTVHKSQGLTLLTAFIDMSGVNWQAGMAYTAISRLTSLGGLHLISFDPKSIRTDNAIVYEYQRLRGLPKFSFDNDTPLPASSPGKSNKRIHIADLTTSTKRHKNNSKNKLTKQTKRPLSPDVTVSKFPKKVKTLTSQEIKMYHFINLDVQQSQNLDSCIGRAHVIDFFNDSRSKNVVTSLTQFGIQVRSSRASIQYGCSCGYIAARLIAKINSLILRNEDWFNAQVVDCNYHGPTQNSLEVYMVIMANIFLGLAGTNTHFLSSSNCVQLIAFYSSMFYNCPMGQLSLHDHNIHQPMNISTFTTQLNNTLYLHHTDGNSVAPNLHMFNRGTHWFVVVY